MNCKCGGELKRIGINCYQCKRCGLKQKVAFLYPEGKVESKVQIRLFDFNTSKAAYKILSVREKEKILKLLGNKLKWF